jgi:hypothetical protein
MEKIADSRCKKKEEEEDLLKDSTVLYIVVGLNALII